MGFFYLGALLVAGVGLVIVFQLWAQQVRLGEEIRRLREAQDTLIDLVSTKLLSDDALEREFLKLKIGRRQSPEAE